VDIGEKIRRIRVLSGISLEDLSKRLCVSMHAVETLEASSANIGRQPLLRIARALEIRVEDIEGFSEETETLEGLRSYRKRLVHEHAAGQYHSLTDRIIKKYDELLATERRGYMKLQRKIAVLEQKIVCLEQRLDKVSGIAAIPIESSLRRPVRMTSLVDDVCVDVTTGPQSRAVTFLSE